MFPTDKELSENSDEIQKRNQSEPGLNSFRILRVSPNHGEIVFVTKTFAPHYWDGTQSLATERVSRGAYFGQG